MATSTAGTAPFSRRPRVPGSIPFPSETADGLPEHSQWSQEFRLASNDWGRFDWQSGLYLYREKITIDSFSYNTLAGSVEDGYARQKQDNKAWALFVSGDYDLTDRWTLKGGLRYTRDEKDFEATRYLSPFGAGPIGPLTANPSDSDVSGDLSISYAANEQVNLYARAAKGFRAPSIQGRLVFGDTISVADSEKVFSYEAGVKADLFDRRARLGFSVFNYTVKDQQLTAVGGAANFNQLVNADKSIGRGFELDLEAYLTDRLLVTLGGSYNKTEIKDPNLYIAPCGGGCTVLDPPRAGAKAWSRSTATRCPRRHAGSAISRRATACPWATASSSSSPTGPIAARSTSSSTSRPNSPANRCSKAACASAICGRTAATRRPCTGATSPTARPSSAASISTT